MRMLILFHGFLLNDSTIEVSSDKTLTYSGDVLEIGALTMTFSGGGNFLNSDNLSLNNEESVLILDGIAKIENVSVTENLTNGFLDVDQNVVITNLSIPKSSRFETQYLFLSKDLGVIITKGFLKSLWICLLNA